MDEEKGININDTDFNLLDGITSVGEIPPENNDKVTGELKINIDDPIILDQEPIDFFKEEEVKQPKKQPTKPRPKLKKENVEEAEEKQSLILRIRGYRDSPRFGNFLTKEMGMNLKPATLDKMNCDELQQLLVRIQYAVSNKSSNNFMDNFVRNNMVLVEKVVHDRTKAKIKGTTYKCFSDDQWLDAYEAVRLEYLSFGLIRPELRLLFCTMSIAGQTHYQNVEHENNIDERIVTNSGSSSSLYREPIMDNKLDF